MSAPESSGAPGARLLTVIIPTFNEEETLPACLASASFADEILVVDSFSTARTLEIAASRRARLLPRAHRHSAPQKTHKKTS